MEMAMDGFRRRAPLFWLRWLALPLALGACAAEGGALAQEALPAAAVSPTYADLVSLAEPAAIVAEATVRDQVVVPPERAPGVRPGFVRLYIQAQTQRVLRSPGPLGESLAYLVDVPLNAKGKAPKLKKLTFIVFADPVQGSPGALQLVQPDAQLPFDPALEGRVRTVVEQLVARDAPPRITGVRDVISVAGNLAGESETQMSIETATGAPGSLTVIRRPNMAPQWGVSWTEVVDQSAAPPQPGTLAWYRLACSLPRQLQQRDFLQADEAGRQRARADYGLILDSLGPCERTRH
jgi:hypothetical protein